ncbi:MAG: Xaa-Pro dipeptidase [Steroidobacterales bacterium]
MAADKLDGLYGDHLQTLMRRADRALEASGFDVLVVHAGSAPTQFLDDQDYPYKVNPHFKAWVPLTDNPQCVLIYRPGNKPKVLFHQPEDFWHKPAPLPRVAWTALVELQALPRPQDASAHWANLGRAALIGPPTAFDPADPGTVNPPELLSRLHYDRAVKTDYEIECLRRANDLAARGHRAARAAFHAGVSEYTAHMRYLDACQQREEDLPYNNIVAYNQNAAILHYQFLERAVPQPLRSLLIDAGAQYRGYAADVTRSYAAASGAYADLVAEVDGAQQALCREIVVGLDYRSLHLTAHRLLGDVLHRIKLINVAGAEALELGLTKVFFPHGIGHLLGLQVHDVGGVMGNAAGDERRRPEGHPYLRLTRTLEPGVVVTVEPGIYFIDSLLGAARADSRRTHIDWKLVEALRPYGGVRIEDDVAATGTGPENITRDAFARLAA